ncbi:hypothetical protein NSE01_35470 [Novosphingobium sediminis]|uniref:Uncharacterized protein n=1 Tax=Novosphingobium sediminis TaxID=707214 RepID=A0A512APT6_9SPHN|nr:hypothetical protein [Novosphingobium sediminis]GEO01715.1 hypothetical protein NSE01_35470 [Novosphingobium sediminis]
MIGSTLVLAMAATGMGPPEITPANAENLCLDQRIRQAVVNAIGEWSQGYPFARVIIGEDARFGEVQSPSVAIANRSYLICAASFSLVKVRQGKAYTVRIERCYYRIAPLQGGYNVRLEDLPARLDGTDISSRELIGRFTIDGRPYADILAENQQRLERRSEQPANQPLIVDGNCGSSSWTQLGNARQVPLRCDSAMIARTENGLLIAFGIKQTNAAPAISFAGPLEGGQALAAHAVQIADAVRIYIAGSPHPIPASSGSCTLHWTGDTNKNRRISRIVCGGGGAKNGQAIRTMVEFSAR